MQQPRRKFLLLAILTAVAAILGIRQTATPAVAAAPNPVFDGVWDHPGLPGFEPLASGPTSLVNLSRRERGVSNNMQLVGDYRNPILKPQTAETVKKFGEMSLAHFGYPTPRNQCWPGGVPFEFTNNGLMMLQKPDEILIIYRAGPQVRHIRMNSSHPAKTTPSWYGDSIGHYEGDTLIVDTVGVKIGPYAMVDWYGTPHSPALHVIERYRLLDFAASKDGLERNRKENFIGDFRVNPNDTGKHLQLYFTVDDPEVFTTPWSATVTYGRVNPLPGRVSQISEWEENICAENPSKYGTERDAQVPTADKPDF